MNGWKFYRQSIFNLDTGEYNPLADRWLWLLASITALLAYGGEITNFSLSIDEELHAILGRSVWQDWLKQGRWGMAGLTFLFPPLSVLPFLPTIIFCAGLVAGAVLFAGEVSKNRREACAFAAIFVSCPIWPHIGEFNTLSWGVGIGLCSCALALRFGRSGGVIGVACCGALLAFSIAIYQSFLTVYVAAALLHYAWAESGDDANRRSLTGLLGGCLAGIAIYYSVLTTSLLLSHFELVYVQDWIGVSQLFAPQNTARFRVVRKLAGLLLGGDPIYLGWGIATLLLCWVGVVVFWGRIVAPGPRSATARILMATVFVAAAGAAMSPVVASTGYAPARSLLAFPVFYAALSSLPFRYRWTNNVAAYGLLGFCLFVNVWIAASLFYSDSLSRTRDEILATRLINRIEEVGRSRFGGNIPIAVAGAWKHSPGPLYHRVEMFGASYFEYDGGSIWRVVLYLERMGLTGVRAVPLGTIPGSIEKIREMPAWPAHDSVAVIDETVVVKFGDLTSTQESSLSR